MLLKWLQFTLSLDLIPQRVEVTHDGWTAFGHNLQTQTPTTIVFHTTPFLCVVTKQSL